MIDIEFDSYIMKNAACLKILLENSNKIEYHPPKNNKCGQLIIPLLILFSMYRTVSKSGITELIIEICQYYNLCNGDLLMSIRTDNTCDIMLMYLKNTEYQTICYADISISDSIAVFNYNYDLYGKFPILYHE